ncbi:MAG: twin-arginine translocation signal domain-containing protein [Comamonadaceae bacterium]|nr:MAG: twin-arginine translocation signal domain-containing protein [Comamonadaceae bacterium]
MRSFLTRAGVPGVAVPVGAQSVMMVSPSAWP